MPVRPEPRSRGRVRPPRPLPSSPAQSSTDLSMALSQGLFVKGWERAVSQPLGSVRQRPCGGPANRRMRGEQGLYPRLAELGGFALREWGPRRGLRGKGTPRRREVGFLSLVELVPSRAILLVTEASREVDPPAPINRDRGQRSQGRPLCPQVSQSRQTRAARAPPDPARDLLPDARPRPPSLAPLEPAPLFLSFLSVPLAGWTTSKVPVTLRF